MTKLTDRDREILLSPMSDKLAGFAVNRSATWVRRVREELANETAPVETAQPETSTPTPDSAPPAPLLVNWGAVRRPWGDEAWTAAYEARWPAPAPIVADIRNAQALVVQKQWSEALPPVPPRALTAPAAPPAPQPQATSGPLVAHALSPREQRVARFARWFLAASWRHDVVAALFDLHNDELTSILRRAA